MAERDVLLKALDAAHWELSEAMIGLPEEDLWKRPNPRLLSVGELLAHMAYGEAQSFLPDGIESPLLTTPVRYYPYAVDAPQQLPLGPEAALQELTRVHEACKASFLASEVALDAPNPFRDGWTWEYTLIYMAFHVAYHTGQIYSVRHLLGHQTVDN